MEAIAMITQLSTDAFTKPLGRFEVKVGHIFSLAASERLVDDNARRMMPNLMLLWMMKSSSIWACKKQRRNVTGTG